MNWSCPAYLTATYPSCWNHTRRAYIGQTQQPWCTQCTNLAWEGLYLNNFHSPILDSGLNKRESNVLYSPAVQTKTHRQLVQEQHVTEPTEVRQWTTTHHVVELGDNGCDRCLTTIVSVVHLRTWVVSGLNLSKHIASLSEATKSTKPKLGWSNKAPRSLWM